MSTSVGAPAVEEHEKEKAALLDEEGDLTPKFEAALIRIFARFSSSYKEAHPDVQASGSGSSASIPRPEATDVLTEADLDAFSTATNGAALPQESKDEIREFLDIDKDGNLTLRGFIEMYHLQSDNDPEETWKDLSKLGFSSSLEYEDERKQATETKAAGDSATDQVADSKN
ncbi:EF-hand domain pair [Kalmanozyma brasiliensis GHG001]|uniref:EF-hand domain-containing protein n=1 Tax=Kalmanozyma brasiliensis (strain GHG001) TaxID=1365824 RepID=V5EH23_KALBG|nr:EF-hand domain pair [Kalmanozyma brasiliensis GHG001]EST09866.1 EF-hand domain pair [Kalmanozyma brasiliensis GHG001]